MTIVTGQTQALSGQSVPAVKAAFSASHWATPIDKSVPAAIPAAPTAGLHAGCERAVTLTIDEKVKEEMAANLPNLTSPLPALTFCSTVAVSYDTYYRSCHAAVMPPSPPAVPILQFFEFQGWGAAFASYWAGTVWKPTGVYTGGKTINAVSVGQELQTAINNLIFVERPQTMLDFADRIAEILSIYTTKLQVQATLSVPPNSQTVTVA